MHEGREPWHHGPGHPWRRSPWRGALWGLFLVIVGVWWLLGERGIVAFNWNYVGPVALILLGIGVIVRRSYWGAGCCYYQESETAPAETPPKPL